MRQTFLSLFLLALAFANAAAFEETVDTLKSRLQNASSEERPQLCVRIAQLRLRDADRLYDEGHVADAHAAVDDIVAYSEKARDAATQSRKHLKSVEIAVRKMSEKLGDIKRTLAFEDQPPLEQAIRRLEEIRTALLDAMFSDKKEKKK